MSGVELREVAADEADLRLDRWFRRHFPDVTHGLLEKWLRQGQVRIDGKRAGAGVRLVPGQLIRIPPQGATPVTAADQPRPPIAAADRKRLQASILHVDDHVIVIDKPAGLAVQGGSKVRHHLDAMLDALCLGGERPRLVHRLDKETSGVLVLARTVHAAASLTAAFRGKRVQKSYWAIVVGAPNAAEGRIALPLVKRGGVQGERVVVDEHLGLPATTLFRVVEKAGRGAAWLALEPITGRTHQLRVHCAALGAPILGDRKYGGEAAVLAGAGLKEGLHLLARRIRFPHPVGGEIVVEAPLPPFMEETWRYFGFSPLHPRGNASDPRMVLVNGGRAKR